MFAMLVSYTSILTQSFLTTDLYYILPDTNAPPQPLDESQEIRLLGVVKRLQRVR